MKKLLFLVVLAGVLVSGCLPERNQVAYGKGLFNEPKLGTTGATCNSCHPNGGTIGGAFLEMPIPSLYGAAPSFPKFKQAAGREITLAEMVNLCIEIPMKGKPLKVDSEEMKALEAYLHTLKGTYVPTPDVGGAAEAPAYGGG